MWDAKGEKMLAFYLSLIDSEAEKSRFEEVYRTYRKQMFTLARTILKNKHDAEDVVHDIFSSIASSHMDVLCNAESEDDIRNYLLKSVKNASVSVIRKRNVRTAYLKEKQEKKLIITDDEFIESVCLKLDCQDIIETIDCLDDKYREVLYYHFVLGLTIPETAQVLERNFNTVQKQLVRGKSLLLNKIACKGGSQNVSK